MSVHRVPTLNEMLAINTQGPVEVGQIYKTRYWGDVKVLEYKRAKDVTVQFVNTGFVLVCHSTSLRRGDVKDQWAAKENGNAIYKQSVRLGDEFYSEKYGVYKVTDYRVYRDVEIEFVNTGYKYRTTSKSILTDNVRDKLAYVIEDIGCFGVGHYTTTSCSKTFANTAYKVWREMLRRCHTEDSSSYGRYGARGVTVCEEWRNFQVFAEWYEKNYKRGFEIDKDILSGSTKIYSPETCRLIPHTINTAVSGIVDGKLINFRGYQYDKRSGKYRVCMRLDGKPYSGSYYESQKDAFMEYKRLKEGELQRVVTEEYERGNIDKLIYETVLSWEIQPHKDDEDLFK